MKGQIPQDVIDRVLAAHDIVDVVGRHLPLKKMGRAWKALCPFHEEKTPSFNVNPERGTFKCFGCGKGGNAFGWLMEKEGLSFPEAVRALAAEKGIVVPDSGGWREPASGTRIEDLRKALALAQDLFTRTLASPAGESTRAYLLQRGFPPPAVREFGLGLSPSGWDGLIQAARGKGLSEAVLAEAGLVIQREGKSGHYDRFRGRLMFPIADAQGRIVTYGARAMAPGDTPKYLNGPETPIFKKGKTLYALDRAKEGIRKAGYAILMEGYTDVLMAHMHGFTCAVAGMGTAFTPEQGRALHTFTEKVVLLYDGDSAGRLAAEKSLDVLLEQGIEVRIALLPEGKDVDEVLLEEGVERLSGILDVAKDLFDFKLDMLGKTVDLGTPRGKSQAAERLAESVRRVKSVLERDLLVRRIVDRLGVREDLFRSVLDAGDAAAARRRMPAPPPARPAAGGAPADGSAPAAPVLPLEARLKAHDRRVEHERLVAGALFRPELFGRVREDLPVEEIQDPGLAAVWREMLAVVEAGEGLTVEVLAHRIGADPAASSALAGLPEELPFEDWVPDALRVRAATRAREARLHAVLQVFAPSSSAPQDGGSGPLPDLRP